MKNRVVVIGASADGIPAIMAILRALPRDFGAPILVAQHVGRRVPSALPLILARATALQVVPPSGGELVQPGRVYVAPHDVHMLVRDGQIVLSSGPEENRFRPSIDVLFRSAAIAYGPRAIGVVLSGYLYDGAAGLRAIVDVGGVAIVQEPTETLASSMPLAALAATKVHHRLRVAEIPRVLQTLVADDPEQPTPAPIELELENRIAAELDSDIAIAQLLERSTHSNLVCPTCAEDLWQLPERRLRRYRCTQGHAFSEDALLYGSADRPLESREFPGLR